MPGTRPFRSFWWQAAAARYVSLPATGTDVKKEDLARLSPLGRKHFKVLGRYHFTVPEEVLGGDLRPPRMPEEADEELQIA
jgi:hypothetical protein